MILLTFYYPKKVALRNCKEKKVHRIGVVILFFFKAQIVANSLRLLAKFETQKKGKTTSQNG